MSAIQNPLAAAFAVVLAMLTVGLLLTLFRLVRGPSFADRVVALDLLSIHAVAIIGTYALAADRMLLLDPAIVLALVGFVATLALARLIERGEAE